ncbi:MAG: hypothetical protein SGILL_001198 [Bacillariaceae sp.]
MARIFTSLLLCGALVLSQLLLLFPATVSAEVESLTDATFEHQTQASTGATTGSWLILFTIPSCESCETYKRALEQVSQDQELYEQGVVFGTVDCSENVAVCQRFSITKLPTLVFMHRKKLYVLPTLLENSEGETESLSMVDQLKAFVLKDFSVTEALPIPDPPSIMDAVEEAFTRLYEAGMETPLLGMAILLMGSMLFLTILALVYVVVIRSNAAAPTSNDAIDESKKKKKNTKKKQ